MHQRKTVKIIFTGAGFGGKGAASMLICTSKTLKHLIPEAEFAVASSNLKYDSMWGPKYGLKVFGCKYARGQINLLMPILRMLGELAKADMVVDLSGLSFTDRFTMFQPAIPSLNILLCKLLRKHFVIYSQALGPFRSWANRLLARLFLPRADLIIIRGEMTRDHLRGIGIEKRVFSYADSAFLLDSAPAETANEILWKEGIERDNDTLLVGVSVNARIYELCGGSEAENSYVKLMAQVADYLVEGLTAKVVFIPFELVLSGYDDRFVARKIYNAARNRHRIKLIENDYSPEELKAVIGMFDLFIGSRFHSIVASTSVNVPTIVISWSHKYKETMKMLGQEKYVCHYETMSFSQLANLVEDALKRKNEIKKELKLQVEKARESALEGAKLIKELLSSGVDGFS